jgi:hypothetical protein
MAEIDAELLQAFKPDAYALLRCIAPRIGLDMLHNIAAADYGSDADAHFAALRKIRDGGPVDVPLEWIPKEVLELRRWSEPDAEDRALRQEELSGLDGHWVRAFSCAVLLRAYENPEDGQSATLIQLVESLGNLTPDLARHAVASLSWLLPRVSRQWGERNYVGLALLFLAVKPEVDVEKEVLEELAEWLIADEEELFEVFGYGLGRHPEIWQLRLAHNLYDRKWIAQAKALVASSGSNKRCGLYVRSVARLLAGEQYP